MTSLCTLNLVLRLSAPPGVHPHLLPLGMIFFPRVLRAWSPDSSLSSGFCLVFHLDPSHFIFLLHRLFTFKESSRYKGARVRASLLRTPFCPARPLNVMAFTAYILRFSSQVTPARGSEQQVTGTGPLSWCPRGNAGFSPVCLCHSAVAWRCS